MNTLSPAEQQQVVNRMQAWLEGAVIGLNLCPFAKQVVAKQRLAWRVSAAEDDGQAYDDLSLALDELRQSPPETLETTVLVLPHALGRFDDFHLFVQLQAEPLLRRKGLRGLIQIAPFHPQFAFAEVADASDISHCTNRSPWPALHLLREDSVARAVATVGGDADRIVQTNLRTLAGLGPEGWAALSAAWTPASSPAVRSLGGPSA